MRSFTVGGIKEDWVLVANPLISMQPPYFFSAGLGEPILFKILGLVYACVVNLCLKNSTLQ